MIQKQLFILLKEILFFCDTILLSRGIDMDYINLPSAQLIDLSLQRKEGQLSSSGALVVYTGSYTGRAPKDKFIVDDDYSHSLINWNNTNRGISKEKFIAIRDKVKKHLSIRDNFIFQGFAGADPLHHKKFKIINELASQTLFISNLLIKPSQEELQAFGAADYTIWVAPSFVCDPAKDGTNSQAFIGIDYQAHEIVICGTYYGGEIKKAVFSTMNFVMPSEGVLPMHCSANRDPQSGQTAIFFGLSGTGKTTLSADESRQLIGDDEHGFSHDGIFNFEGGCYAKCIDLREDEQPEIYHAIRRGSYVENVPMNEKGEFDFFDASITENTRAGYPLNYINNARIPSVGGIPKVIIFLTADAFGVLPPVSKLTKEGAMYHFVTGFTSKVAGTEAGIKEPVPTFSTLFGEPFMPLSPDVYAKMLGERIEKFHIDVYLVNTGWAGGKATDGAKRIKLSYTRKMINAILDGSIKNSEFKHHPIFNLDYALDVSGVPSNLLDPKEYWSDKDKYDETAYALSAMFKANFEKKYASMPKEVKLAGPQGK